MNDLTALEYAQMRIAYVTPGIGGGGGAERSLAAMAPFLTDEIELHVITYTSREHLRDELVDAGVIVSRIEGGSPLRVLRQLRHKLESVKPDLVHTTLIDADILGRIAAVSCGIPVVSSLVNDSHGLERLVYRPIQDAKSTAVWGANIVTARSVVRFHALTNHVARTMSKRLLIPLTRIDVIPRGRSDRLAEIDRAMARTEARRSLGISEDTELVMAAARHERQKGLDVLIRASRRLCDERPHVMVVIGGRDGNETRHLHELINTLNLRDNVRLIGQRDDVAELMCAADVWCVPSRWEGLGGILIEAMAVGVPTVASAVPAIVELAGSRPVFELVPPDDDGALAAGICKLLDDPHRSEGRTQRGRARFLDEFTSPAIAARMVEFYERSLDKSRLHRQRRS